jgi:hypothetical protein
MSLKLINPLDDDDEEEDLLRFTESKLMDGDSDSCSVEVQDGANDAADLIEADFTNSTPLSRDSSTLVSDKYGSAFFLPSRNFHLAPPLAMLLTLVLLSLGLLLAFVLTTFSLFETNDPKS